MKKTELKTLGDLYDLSDFESNGSKSGVKIYVQDLRQVVREWVKEFNFRKTCNELSTIEYDDGRVKENPDLETDAIIKMSVSTIDWIKHFFNLEDER